MPSPLVNSIHSTHRVSTRRNSSTAIPHRRTMPARSTSSRLDRGPTSLEFTAVFGILACLFACGVAANIPRARVDTLAPRSLAFLYDGDDEPVNVSPPGPETEGCARLQSIALPAGTHVVILEDTPKPEDTRPDLRPVKVRVEDGVHEGLVGTVARCALRAGR